MTPLAPGLLTPIYLRTSADEPLPEDKMSYILSRDGLFVCRNHRFFQSCVPARNFPSELAEQAAALHLAYPPIPRPLLEQLVGFFDAAWRTFGSEAAALLAWNDELEQVQAIVPPQTVTVCRNAWGEVYPIGVYYETPADLPPHVQIFADIHSHCDMDAFASSTDAEDETFRAGLHIVVGRLDREPPHFFAAAVVDGSRFKIPAEQLLAEYQQRDESFPPEWMQTITVKRYGSFRSRYD